MQSKPITAELLTQILSQKFQTRFWSKISKSEGCWEWKASTNNKGYGQVNLGRTTGKLVMGLAHRTAWISHHKKDVPEGLYLIHSCDNPLCCNPDHIQPGTQFDNIADMDKKGRRVNTPHFGESHGMAKFTSDQIKQIRERYSTGDFTYPELGKIFGVGRTYIGKIIRRQLWNSV